VAHDNPTLQGADEPSRFLGVSGLQWLVVLPVGLFSLFVLHRVIGGVWFLSPLVLVCGAFWLTHGVRFEPVAANLLGFARRRFAALPRPSRTPRVTVGDDGVLAMSDGLRTVLAVDLTDIDSRTPGDKDTLSAGLARLAATRRPGQMLQLVVESTALDGAATMADIAARQAHVSRLTPALAEWKARDNIDLAAEMASRYVGTLRGYVVVGAARRTLFGERDGMTALRRAVEVVQGQLTGLGLGSRALTAEGVRALLGPDPFALDHERLSHVRAHGRYAATISLLLPDQMTSPGWLAPLIEGLGVPFRLAIHVEGLDRVDEARRFGRRRNVETEESAGQAGHGKQLVRSQRTGVVRWGLYLTLFAGTEEGLREAVARARETFEVDLTAQTARGLGHQAPSYWATLPTGYDTANRRWRIDTPTVGNAFPFLQFNPGTGDGLSLGFAGNQLVRVRPDHPEHRNAIVTVYGLTGSGKTVLFLKLVKDALFTGARGTVVELTGDPDRGIPSHYETLCAVAGGDMLYLGAEDPPALNMWDGDIKYVRQAHEILMGEPGKAFPKLWRSLLGQGVRAVKERHGARALERHLYAWLQAEAQDAERPQIERDALREMQSDLEAYVGDGEHAVLFDRGTSIDWESRLLVFNLRGVDDSLNPLLMYLITGAVARRGRRTGEPLPIVGLDEGWRVAEFQAGARALNEWARRGRHTQMYLVFLTQALRDLRKNPIAQALFEAASITVLMRLGDEADDLIEAFGLTPQEVATIKSLQKTSDAGGGSAEGYMIRQVNTQAKPVRGKVRIPTTGDELGVFLNDPLDQVWRRQRLIEEHGDTWAGCKAFVAARARDATPTEGNDDDMAEQIDDDLLDGDRSHPPELTTVSAVEEADKAEELEEADEAEELEEADEAEELEEADEAEELEEAV